MNQEDMRLAKITEAQRYLIEAKTVKDVKTVRDQAQAIRTFLSQQGACLEVQNQAAELKLRAERKLGTMLKETGRNQGRPEKTLHDERFSQPTLADQGITEIQSHRWQKVAAVPDEDFEQYIAATNARREDLTTAGVVRLANKSRTPEDSIETPPLPKATYRCIIIDPPWPMTKILRDTRENQTGDLDYPTMSLEAITNLPVPSLTAPTGCHVYLWVTQRFLRDGFSLFDAWGITYQCLLTWVKNVGITPFSWMYDTEHVLFGRVGSLDLQVLGQRLSFSAPVTTHSTKPQVFYDRVALVSPEPRLEMFARQPHEGFEGWGHETMGAG